jgi:uncharacterized protein
MPSASSGFGEVMMMRNAIVAMATGLAGIFLFPSPAQAASFDCARATRADEIAICRNPRLSELDSEMAGLWYAWSRVPMLMGGNGARMDSARAFLARRAACGRDTACLTAAYRARIEELHRNIAEAMRDFQHYVSG